jgi:prepilin-type N-terminal cleavage/methylation domain-containing protein
MKHLLQSLGRLVLRQITMQGLLEGEAPAEPRFGGRLPLQIKGNRTPASRRPEAGFTLLELIASVAVMSILAVILFQTFTQATRAWEQGQKRVETSQDTRASLDFMARELSQAIVSSKLLFNGQIDAIEFFAPVNNVTNGAGGIVDLCQVYYFLSNSIPQSLVRNVYAWPGGAQIGNGIVADNITYLKFDYYTSIGNDLGTTSATSWDSTTKSNQAPSSVEITIATIDSRSTARPQSQWPAFSVTNVLRVAIPTGNRRISP